MQIGKGVRISAVLRLHAQGSPETTNRPLDMSVEGEGLFQVQRPDGTVAYTRDGSFTLDASGALVTTGGSVRPGMTA
ncbi:MAG: flagellar hook-basal body complex protein [bacterium]